MQGLSNYLKMCIELTAKLKLSGAAQMKVCSVHCFLIMLCYRRMDIYLHKRIIVLFRDME